ncbi:hypothetical protein H8356DRAFT_1731315 [Neocallimastix lanati (nom. inval.)]|nr:hypothetical protein H8356DRAFT_1731315 [Neocallimastix sp. JGI-2020a]
MIIFIKYKLILDSFDKNNISINNIKENISCNLFIKGKFIADEFSIEIRLKRKDSNNNDIIGMLCNKINELEEEKNNMNKNVNELESKNNNLNTKRKDSNNNDIIGMLCNKINELEEEKNNMKNEIKELKFKSDYKIIKDEDELNFIKNRLLQIPGRENSNISLSLKFRLTENGNSINTYHSICNNIPNNLVLIKTTEGTRFGGYTDKAWTSCGENIVDNNSFCFSLSRNKIYNIITDKIAIGDDVRYGPMFRDNIFYIGSGSLNNGGCSKNSQSNFLGEEMLYEINDGKEKFTVIEFEFYQVVFE